VRGAGVDLGFEKLFIGCRRFACLQCISNYPASMGFINDKVGKQFVILCIIETLGLCFDFIIIGLKILTAEQKSSLEMSMDLITWIRQDVLVLYLGEERFFIMFMGFQSLVFNLFMCADQLYLLFRVRPRIFVLLGSGMFTEPVRILDLQLCLRQICRLGNF